LASSSLSVTDRTKVDHNVKQGEDQQKTREPIHIETKDKEVPSLHNRSKSFIPIQQHSTNVRETTSDKQSTLYEKDVIRFEEEHAMSIIVPDQDISILDQSFQVVQTKISQKKSAISLEQVSHSEDQITLLHDEKNNDNIQKGSSNSDHNSNDTSKKSPSLTPSHEHNFDQEKQSTSSVINDEPQSMTTQHSFHSDIDLSEQLDQLQLHKDTTSSEELVADSASASEEKFESPQKQFDSQYDEKISPVLVPEHIAVNFVNLLSTLITNIESFSMLLIILVTRLGH